MSELSKLKDEEVVERTRTKDKQAFAEIIKRYQDKLLRYATHLVGDEDKAADIVQESLVKAYTNINGFNAKMKFSSWIYRIVHNQAVNFVKRNSKEISLIGNVDFDSGIDVEKEYSRKEIVKMVRKCISKIPNTYKEPLSLYFLEEKSYSEISDILRIPIGTVGTRINRAKALMKKVCQKIKG